MVDKNQMKIATFGAAAGLVTPFLMQYIIMPVLNFFGGFVPAFSLKLADVSVSVRDSLTGIEGGMAGWLVDAFGLTISVPFQTYIMSAVGGALFFLVGAFVAEKMGFLKGDPAQKTRVVIWTGNIAAGLLIGTVSLTALTTIGIDLVNVLIAFIVNAAILAWVYVWIDKQFKIGLIPF